MKSVKLAFCGALAALALSAPAQAASLLFKFNEAASLVNITSNSPDFCIFGSCALSADLTTPFPEFTLNEGDSFQFNFANFNVSSGFGWDTDARVEAILAFTNPVADPANTGGTANYLRLGGIFTPGLVAGSLIWDNPVQQIAAADGSLFTVSFGNLEGVTFGSNAIAPVTITLDKVAAVPEPATWAMMLIGFFGAGAMVRARRREMVAA